MLNKINFQVASFFFSKKSNYATEASFETKPFRLHKLTQGPSTQVTVTRDDAIQLFKHLHTIRRIETAAGNLYKEKIIRGFCHLYSGQVRIILCAPFFFTHTRFKITSIFFLLLCFLQEACAVGMKAALRSQDAVITAYRAHGWTYLMGIEPFGVLAELTGRQGGNAKGKGGSMHMYTKNFYGGNGIVGAQVGS